jgi:signal transduction histidine kinase
MVRALEESLFERLPTTFLLLLFFPISAIIGGIAAVLLLKLLLKRLSRLELLTHQVASGDLSARISNPGDDELGRLGKSFNQMAETLEHSSKKVEEAETQRRHLLADISHELATPLTSIRGYSETMLDDQIPIDPDESKEYLNYIYKESVRMGHLIQDLLELARIEAGHRTLDYEPLDWANLCHNTTIRMMTQFRKARLKLEFEGMERTAMIRGDGIRLEQVLDNLLINALRYVPAGCRVLVLFKQSPTQQDFWQLEVQDNGRGIPEHDLPHIFDRFYRSQATRTGKGSGLGLAIVKELVNRHGGSISASRNKDGGATFCIQIPKLRQTVP